jgi:hypothetical protein
MLRALHEEHELADLLWHAWSNVTTLLRPTLWIKLFNSSEQRLARALLMLSRVGKENKNETVIRN